MFFYVDNLSVNESYITSEVYKSLIIVPSIVTTKFISLPIHEIIECVIYA